MEKKGHPGLLVVLSVSFNITLPRGPHLRGDAAKQTKCRPPPWAVLPCAAGGGSCSERPRRDLKKVPTVLSVNSAARFGPGNKVLQRGWNKGTLFSRGTLHQKRVKGHYWGDPEGLTLGTKHGKSEGQELTWQNQQLPIFFRLLLGTCQRHGLFSTTGCILWVFELHLLGKACGPRWPYSGDICGLPSDPPLKV